MLRIFSVLFIILTQLNTDAIIIIIIIIFFTPSGFFARIFISSISLVSKWQHVFSGLQDASQYSSLS